MKKNICAAVVGKQSKNKFNINLSKDFFLSDPIKIRKNMSGLLFGRTNQIRLTNKMQIKKKLKKPRRRSIWIYGNSRELVDGKSYPFNFRMI